MNHSASRNSRSLLTSAATRVGDGGTYGGFSPVAAFCSAAKSSVHGEPSPFQHCFCVEVGRPIFLGGPSGSALNWRRRSTGPVDPAGGRSFLSRRQGIAGGNSVQNRRR